MRPLGAIRRPGSPSIPAAARPAGRTEQGGSRVFPPLRLQEAFRFGGLAPRELAVRTWRVINEHEIFTRAAAVSFYAMLAMVPFLALTLTVAVQQLPDITGRGRARGMGDMTVGQLETTVQSLVPREASQLVFDQIARIQKQPPVGLLSVGLAVSLWLASSLFLAIMDAMNNVYGVQETRSFLRLRLVAMLMTIIQAAILMASLIAIVAWPQILRALHLDPNGTSAWLVTGARWAGVVVMVMISFALSFYVAPNAHQSWEWVSPGSLIGTLLFLGFCGLFRVYVQNFANYDKTYGSLGGVMVILFWFWVVSVLLLTTGAMNKIIQDASPLGTTGSRKDGPKLDPTQKPDFAAMPPEPRPS